MTKHKSKNSLERLQKISPYLISGVTILALVFIGSIDKHSSEVSLSLDNFAANNYDVSTDQLSELYVVADLSDALGLASAADVASNYIITNTMYDAGQTSTGKLEKPNLTNVGTSRGIIEHTVAEGENIEEIAWRLSSKYSSELKFYKGLSFQKIALDLNLKKTNCHH